MTTGTDRRSGRQRTPRPVPAPLTDVQGWLHPYERFWRGRPRELGALLGRFPDEEPT